MNSSEITNPYSVLGVPKDSSYEEIRSSYQRLVLKLHPDKLNGSLSEKERKKAHEKFLAIDKAWKVLCNQEMRENYDRQLKEQGLSQNWPISAYVDLDEMEYHEDSASYTSPCRCTGDFVITDCDLEIGRSVVCCSNCTLSIRVLYHVLSDDDYDDRKREKEKDG